MKKIVYLMLFCTGMMNAQIVNIPDPVFKAALLESGQTNLLLMTAIMHKLKLTAITMVKFRSLKLWQCEGFRSDPKIR